MHIVNTGRAANKGGLRTNRRPVVRSPGTADIDCVTGTIRLTEWDYWTVRVLSGTIGHRPSIVRWQTPNSPRLVRDYSPRSDPPQ